MKKRKTPEREAGAGFSIDQFCKRNNLSQSKYYRLRDQGKGPAEVRTAGAKGHVLITPEAEAAWRKRWTQEPAQKGEATGARTTDGL